MASCRCNPGAEAGFLKTAWINVQSRWPLRPRTPYATNTPSLLVPLEACLVDRASLGERVHVIDPLAAGLQEGVLQAGLRELLLVHKVLVQAFQYEEPQIQDDVSSNSGQQACPHASPRRQSLAIKRPKTLFIRRMRSSNASRQACPHASPRHLSPSATRPKRRIIQRLYDPPSSFILLPFQFLPRVRPSLAETKRRGQFPTPKKIKNNE